MTKQEALQKIEELRKFVDELDKQKLEHGNLIELVSTELHDIKRLVVDTTYLDGEYNKRFILLNSKGNIMNRFTDLSNTISEYTKIRNVFRD